jgi:hypothetical protein
LRQRQSWCRLRSLQCTCMTRECLGACCIACVACRCAAWLVLHGAVLVNAVILVCRYHGYARLCVMRCSILCGVSHVLSPSFTDTDSAVLLPVLQTCPHSTACFPAAMARR